MIYGIGTEKCANLLVFIANQNTTEVLPAVAFVQGALTVMSTALNRDVFPSGAANRNGQYIVTAIRARCSQHPEWTLAGVTGNIISAIPTENSLFAPYQPSRTSRAPDTLIPTR
jgi:hypothetical protein